MVDESVLKQLGIAFFKDGFKIAEEELGSNRSLNGLVRMSEKAYIYINEFNRSFESSCTKEGLKIDCKKACSYCCHQSVFIVPHEAIYLAYYIKRVLPEEKQKKILQKAIEKDSKTSKMKAHQFLHHKEACPLLENDSCSVYTARPMACRIYFSSDVNTCMNEMNKPADFSQFPALYDIPLQAGRMLNEGICAFLTHNKIKPFEWMLENSLVKALQDETMINGWLNGDNSFKVRDLDEEENKYLEKFDIGKKS